MNKLIRAYIGENLTLPRCVVCHSPNQGYAEFIVNGSMWLFDLPCGHAWVQDRNVPQLAQEEVALALLS